MDRALVTLLALNFFVNALLICYLLPNNYINNLLEGILCSKCVEVESLYGILWHCPALRWDVSLFCAHRYVYKGTMVWELHRKVGVIPGDSFTKPVMAVVHGPHRSYPYFQLFQ
jgi:hypothetical protein